MAASEQDAALEQEAAAITQKLVAARKAYKERDTDRREFSATLMELGAALLRLGDSEGEGAGEGTPPQPTQLPAK